MKIKCLILIVTVIMIFCACSDKSQNKDQKKIIEQELSIKREKHRQKQRALLLQYMTLVAYKNESKPEIVQNILKEYYSSFWREDLFKSKFIRGLSQKDNYSRYKARDIAVIDLANKYGVSKKFVVNVIIDFKNILPE